MKLLLWYWLKTLWTIFKIFIKHSIYALTELQARYKQTDGHYLCTWSYVPGYSIKIFSSQYSATTYTHTHTHTHTKTQTLIYIIIWFKLTYSLSLSPSHSLFFPLSLRLPFSLTRVALVLRGYGRGGGKGCKIILMYFGSRQTDNFVLSLSIFSTL